MLGRVSELVWPSVIVRPVCRVITFIASSFNQSRYFSADLFIL